MLILLKSFYPNYCELEYSVNTEQTNKSQMIL